MTERSPTLQPTAPSDLETGDGVDLELLRAIVRRRRWLFVAVLGVVVVIGALRLALQQPVYQAQTTLLVSGTGARQAALPSLAEAAATRLNISTGSNSLETARQLLQSLDVIEQAVKELGVHTPLDKIRPNVQAEIQPKSELIVLSVDDPDPRQASALADKIAQLYVKQSGRFAQAASRRAIAQLEESLKQVRVDLSQAEEALVAYQAAHGLSDLQIELARATTEVTEVERAQVAARLERQAASRAADYYRQRLARETRTEIASSAITRNPLVVQAQSALATLEVERAGLAATHGPEHVTIKELDQRIAQARAEISRSVESVVESKTETLNATAEQMKSLLAVTEAQALGAQAREAALAPLMSRLDAQLQAMPREKVEVGRLVRRTELDTQLYTDLMRQYQITSAAARFNEPTATIVSPARSPQAPIRPQRKLGLMLTVLLGLVLGVMAAAIAELADTRLHTEEDVRAHVQLPMLGHLDDTRGLPALLCGGGAGTGEFTASALADQFRVLRRDLRGAGGAPRPRTFLVASADAGDGRTAVALNLAVVAAQAGERALLIEGDLRRPGLAQVWPEQSDRAGLAAVLSGSASAADVVQATPVAGLQVVVAGPVSGSPTALLDAPQAAQAWATWAEQADMILVDSPATADHPDVLLLAPMCDAVVLLVRSGQTTRRAARRTVERLRGAGATLAGAVVNRV